MDKNREDLAATILSAYKKTRKTRNELSRRAGVGYPVVHGFVAGHRDIAISTASKLCTVLGLGLRPSRTRKKEGTRRAKKS